MNKLKVIYVFFHMGKTGGTSFTNHIASCFSEPEEQTPMLNLYQKRIAAEEGRVYWLDKPLKEKLKAQIISGHDANRSLLPVLGNHAHLLFITFFRDPGSRFVSHYNFQRSRGVLGQRNGFDDFINDKAIEKSQLRFFLLYYLGWSPEEFDKLYFSDNRSEILNIALNALDEFFFVGLHNYYKDDMQVLTSHLSLPPVEKSFLVAGKDVNRYAEHNREIDNRLREQIPLEFEFYDQLLVRRTRYGSPINISPQPEVLKRRSS